MVVSWSHWGLLSDPPLPLLECEAVRTTANSTATTTTTTSWSSRVVKMDTGLWGSGDLFGRPAQGFVDDYLAFSLYDRLRAHLYGSCMVGQIHWEHSCNTVVKRGWPGYGWVCLVRQECVCVVGGGGGGQGPPPNPKHTVLWNPKLHKVNNNKHVMCIRLTAPFSISPYVGSPDPLSKILVPPLVIYNRVLTKVLKGLK